MLTIRTMLHNSTSNMQRLVNFTGIDRRCGRVSIIVQPTAMDEGSSKSVQLTMSAEEKTIRVFHAKMEIGSVTIYRPFGEFRRANSYCHLYDGQG
ncbi:hypothetical protein TNCV_3658111 [Trichonephila clavipes]|nr:hypothetical protein TNCV_3658111 [Trichonephila clavipes]